MTPTRVEPSEPELYIATTETVPVKPVVTVPRVLDGTKLILIGGWLVSIIALIVSYKMFGSDMMLTTVFTGSITAFSAALFRDIK